MTRHTPNCPGQETPLFSVPDYNRRKSDEHFPYLCCGICGLIRLSAVPARLEDYYKEDYYSLPSAARLRALARRDRCRIKTVQHYTQGKRLLEIGPAFGTFAYQAKQAGFQVDTIEMDQRCCDYLERQIGVKAVRSSTPEIAIENTGKHDAIALWHVIEHLQDPWAMLDAAAANLDAGGVLFIATPNPEAWQFAIMGKYWPHLDAPRHLYLLPINLLTQKAAALGLERIYLTTTDSEAKRWNRFGWQRLLMNPLRNSCLRGAAFIGGFALSLVLSPFEYHGCRGSSYTVAYRKIPR